MDVHIERPPPHSDISAFELFQPLLPYLLPYESFVANVDSSAKSIQDKFGTLNKFLKSLYPGCPFRHTKCLDLLVSVLVEELFHHPRWESLVSHNVSEYNRLLDRGLAALKEVKKGYDGVLAHHPVDDEILNLQIWQMNKDGIIFQDIDTKLNLQSSRKDDEGKKIIQHFSGDISRHRLKSFNQRETKRIKQLLCSTFVVILASIYKSMKIEFPRFRVSFIELGQFAKTLDSFTPSS